MIGYWWLGECATEAVPTDDMNGFGVNNRDYLDAFDNVSDYFGSFIIKEYIFDLPLLENYGFKLVCQQSIDYGFSILQSAVGCDPLYMRSRIR